VCFRSCRYVFCKVLMGHASYSTTEINAKSAPDQAAELGFAERAFMPAESRLYHA
jgi:hypothetical protein